MKLATELRSFPTAAAIWSCVSAELVGQPLIRQRFVDRIEILALDVLDQRELEQLLVGAFGDVAHDDRHLVQAGALRGAPAALAGDDAIRRRRCGARESAG